MFQAWSIPHETPPPTLKKFQTPKPPTLKNSGVPPLASYLLLGHIMAAMQDYIKGLALQELLKEKMQK